MALNSTETVVKGAGDVYLAPLGTGAPVAADLADAAALELDGWVHIGALHEDGPTFEGFEGDVNRFNIWNRQAPFRVQTVIGEPVVNVPLVQFNQENLQRYFPGATIDVNGDVVIPDTPGSGDEKELLVVVEDGSFAIGIWIAKTTARPSGPLEFPGDEFSQIPIAFDVLAPTSGGLGHVIGVEAAVEESA
jgi:hypothetical protein